MIDISIKNLNKSFLQPDSENKHKYNILQIIKDLNLNIKQNEVVSFVGPSGIGKSTLLNLSLIHI